ncbi:hypothetical protein HPB50_029223 [Hyalomma asiaticum]|nr:hypothetical protein HPB50_029223 [Hyalomma asiaticum]
MGLSSHCGVRRPSLEKVRSGIDDVAFLFSAGIACVRLLSGAPPQLLCLLSFVLGRWGGKGRVAEGLALPLPEALFKRASESIGVVARIVRGVRQATTLSKEQNPWHEHKSHDCCMESGQGPREVAVDSGQASTAAALLKDGLGQLSLGPADPGAASSRPPEASSPGAAAATTSKAKGSKKTQGKSAKAKRQQLCLATCERGRLSLSDPSNLRANASSAAAARSPLAGRHPSVPLSASPSSSLSGAASWGPTRDRAASDPRRGLGAALLPPELKAQHAAHRCKRTGGGPPPGSRFTVLMSQIGKWLQPSGFLSPPSESLQSVECSDALGGLLPLQ